MPHLIYSWSRARAILCLSPARAATPPTAPAIVVCVNTKRNPESSKWRFCSVKYGRGEPDILEITGVPPSQA